MPSLDEMISSSDNDNFSVAAGPTFSRLLRELASEHIRIKEENAKLSRKIEPSAEKAQGTSMRLDEPWLPCDVAYQESNPQPDRAKTMSSDSVPQSQASSVDTSSSKARRKLSSDGALVLLHAFWTRELPTEEEAMDSHVKSLSDQVPLSDLHACNDLTEDGCLQQLIIGPNTPKRTLWDFVSILALSTDIVLVPLIAFEMDYSEPLMFVGLFCTIFWTLDIGASFITGHHVQGKIEMRPSKVCKIYLRSWFGFDLTVVIADWLLFVITSKATEAAGVFRGSKAMRLGRVMRALRIFRLIRLLKLPLLLQDLAAYMQTDGLLITFKIVQSLCFILVANHFLACGFYAVGRIGSPSWIAQMDEEDRSLSYRYSTSLHWSLTQFTPASMEVFPTSLPERVYAICVLFFALVVFSSFVSSITNALVHLRQINEASTKQRVNLRRYFSENRLSLELIHRINAFARHVHVRSTMRVHETDIDAFKVLPESLRLRLHWEVYVPMLSEHPFFLQCVQFFEPSVLHICAECLHELSLLTSQELFNHPQEALKMYFVISGKFEYFDSRTDIQRGVVKQCTWCSEAALWLSWKHQGQLVAFSRSELIGIDARVFRNVAATRSSLLGACKVYAVAFHEAAANLSVETHPVDLFTDILWSEKICKTSFENSRRQWEMENGRKSSSRMSSHSTSWSASSSASSLISIVPKVAHALSSTLGRSNSN